MEYELLAPVGNFRNLHAAIEAGADAIYFGVKGLNMRDSAKNFSIKDFKKIRKICDTPKKQVKMYLTLNIVVYNDELKKIEQIIKKAKDLVDAIICWEMAVIELCQKYNLPFHISTQASVSNLASAKFYKKLGAERIILARELNLKQIKSISRHLAARGIPSQILSLNRLGQTLPSKKGNKVPASSCKVECFCHGAMCVAVSGRCFMSQYVHGLSANRGKCAQLCRRSWEIIDDSGNKLKLENSRIMSAKDLCALPFIEKMKESGITSFKIEGRNRSPEYVYNVVSEYRKALDKKLNHNEILAGIENLKKVYNRGFSSGFYLKMPTADDFSFSENGEQTERKEFVGKAYKYWKKVGVASVKMNTGQLKIGDDVYLIRDDESIKKAVVKSIELERKRVKIAKKGDDIGIDFGTEVKNGTEIYLIRKN